MNRNTKILSRIFLTKLLFIIITILLIFTGYNLYVKFKTIENFDEEMIKNKYPDILIDTGYKPHLYTSKQLPNNIFDKYSIISTKRDLKEFAEVLYLGNPL
jgi:hypothetical protein